MAKNPGVVVADGIAKAFEWLVGATQKVVGIADKVLAILKREKGLQPNFVSGVHTLVLDITTLVSEAEAAATADGLNFVVDSAAYSALMKLVNDSKAFVPVVEQAIAALK